MMGEDETSVVAGDERFDMVARTKGVSGVGVWGRVKGRGEET